jgi:hypothetical protein
MRRGDAMVKGFMRISLVRGAKEAYPWRDTVAEDVAAGWSVRAGRQPRWVPFAGQARCVHWLPGEYVHLRRRIAAPEPESVGVPLSPTSAPQTSMRSIA